MVQGNEQVVDLVLHLVVAEVLLAALVVLKIQEQQIQAIKDLEVEVLVMVAVLVAVALEEVELVVMVHHQGVPGVSRTQVQMTLQMDPIHMVDQEVMV